MLKYPNLKDPLPLFEHRVDVTDYNNTMHDGYQDNVWFDPNLGFVEIGWDNDYENLNFLVKKWSYPDAIYDNSKEGIYLIQCGIDVKIGITSNIWGRFSTIQSGTPYDLELLAYYRNSHAGTLELSLHKMFKNFKTRGEWFRLNNNQLRYIKSILEKYQSIKNPLIGSFYNGKP